MDHRVTEERVVRYWLQRELDDRRDRPDPSAVSTAGALDALLSEKPGAASFIWRERPIGWYRLELSRAAFTDLHPVGGPDDLLWRSLSTDGTILGVAEWIRQAGPDELAEETDVDLEAVSDYRETVRSGGDVDPLIVRTRRGATPWYVVDGNHRATAVALHLLETGEYDPVSAYVAVTANPVLRPLVERILGLFQRVIGNGPARRR
jgi:hypothetical protein